jgi:hypothetical protein
MEEALG